MDIESMTITPKGFHLTFTKDIPEELADQKYLKFSSFTLQPNWLYGGDPQDLKDHPIAGVRKTNARRIEVELNDFSAGRIYRLDLENVKTEKVRTEIQNQKFFYTANQLPKG